MYLALFRRWLTQRQIAWNNTLYKSGIGTSILLLAALAIVALTWQAHRLGRFGELKKQLAEHATVPDTTAKPGGKEPVRLERLQAVADETPQFISATLLPGRGMNVFQIEANLPQRGNVPLLASPALREAEHRMTGIGADSNGEESLAMGGAIEVPWAGKIHSAPLATGRGLSVASKEGGLLLQSLADNVTTSVMPDGGEAEGTFNVEDFDGRWPSQTAVKVSVELSARAIEMTITARNTGDKPEPMGIGWAPRFAIPGHREQVMLRLPQGDRIEMKDPKDRLAALPTGRLLAVAGGADDFTGRYGTRLGSADIDTTFTNLREGLMDSGPIAELRYLEAGFGLRMKMLTPKIRAVRINAPASGGFISIEPRFNYDAPFGTQWPHDEDTGMVMLQPGQSTQWRIRLEIFSLDAERSAPTL